MPKKERQKQGNVGVIDKQKNKLQKPKKYKVVFYNDDYTPMDFVAQVLMQLYHKDKETAVAITLMVHNEGRGIAGTYSKEIAETKARQTNDAARAHGHPLKCEMEEG